MPLPIGSMFILTYSFTIKMNFKCREIDHTQILWLRITYFPYIGDTSMKMWHFSVHKQKAFDWNAVSDVGRSTHPKNQETSKIRKKIEGDLEDDPFLWGQHFWKRCNVSTEKCKQLGGIFGGTSKIKLPLDSKFTAARFFETTMWYPKWPVGRSPKDFMILVKL